jgi:hypothetical protein
LSICVSGLLIDALLPFCAGARQPGSRQHLGDDLVNQGRRRQIAGGEAVAHPVKATAAMPASRAGETSATPRACPVPLPGGCG